MTAESTQQPGTEAKTPENEHLPVKILVATMTGNARDCAQATADALARHGRSAEVLEIERYSADNLPSEKGPLLVATSTFGNGEAPDCAYGFWETVLRRDFPRLDQLHYSVLALGDSAYPRFCQFGKDLDKRLQELGATPVNKLATCDVDYEETFEAWLKGCLDALT